MFKRICVGVLGLSLLIAISQRVTFADQHEKKEQAKRKIPHYLDMEHSPTGEGWVDLIGKDLTGWVQREKGRPMSWVATKGMLINFSTHEHPGCDLFTEKKFDDFEVYYEYLIPHGSNSGFYFRGRYEIQIIDDAVPELQPYQRNGSLYGFAPPPEGASRKPNEWQSVYGRIVGNRLSVVLNGKKIFDNVEVPRATGGELDQDYAQPGPILLQGNHGSIMFRNLKVRPIEKK